MGNLEPTRRWVDETIWLICGYNIHEGLVVCFVIYYLDAEGLCPSSDFKKISIKSNSNGTWIFYLLSLPSDVSYMIVHYYGQHKAMFNKISIKDIFYLITEFCSVSWYLNSSHEVASKKDSHLILQIFYVVVIRECRWQDLDFTFAIR